MSEQYIIFGAGYYGRCAYDFLGEEGIRYYVDNDPKKNNTELFGKKIYMPTEDKINCDNKILIAVSKDNQNNIARQLAEMGCSNFRVFSDVKKERIQHRIEHRIDYISVYKKAIEWIYRNTIHNEGIINNSKLKKSYPEVTGYFIPSLMHWGQRKLAYSYAEWLCRIQRENGSWYDTEDMNPYVFDTAQILKGLIAVREYLPHVDTHIIKGCEWLLSNMQMNGRLAPATENAFDGKESSELIHIYCLSPLVKAARLYNRPELENKAYKILYYYLDNYMEDILNFSLLSHFYSYVIEGLIDMGKSDIAIMAMENITPLQRKTGEVGAYKDKTWVCSTGLFQLALIWYKLGNIEQGDRAFSYACGLQNPDGGWDGSYPDSYSNENNEYFPMTEISWAVKYFLDALEWKNKLLFEKQASLFKDSYAFDDGRYRIVEDIVRELVESGVSKLRILDIGCGKGAYINNLIKVFPECEFYACDISSSVLGYIHNGFVIKKEGCITCIPWEDGYFDMVYACEVLEHAIDIESSINEMSRVIRHGGYLAVIDKNRDSLGEMDIEDCEQWIDSEEMKSFISSKYYSCKVVDNISYEDKKADGLFNAWIGKGRNSTDGNN